MNLKAIAVNFGSPVKVEARPVSTNQALPALAVHSQWGSVDLVDEIADEWRQLCQEGPCNEPFYRPEWIAAAIRAFCSRQRVLLVTVRNGRRLRAVLPLVEYKGWIGGMAGTCLRSASLIPRFDFVHGDGPDAANGIHAIWQHLRNLPGWDAIELVNVPEGGASERLLATAREERFPTCQYEYARSPYIPLDGQRPGGDFSRFGRSSRFRYHLRQGWREMNKRGTLHLRRAETVDPETLRLFYQMEQRGWKGKKGTAIACSREMQQFYDAIVRGAEQFGYLSMYFLEQGNTTVAAHLAFTYGGRYYPVKVAYDENFSIYGPGHLIIGRVLEDCIERGLTEFDCLGDWSDAKAKWTEQVRPHTFCAIFRNTLAGHALRAGTQLQHDLRQTAFRLLRPVVRGARSFVVRQKRWLSAHSRQNETKIKVEKKD